MSTYPKSLQKLIRHFAKLPGIGPKAAERLVFYLIDNSFDEFTQDLSETRNSLTHCNICGNIADSNSCLICRNQDRDHTLIAVIAKPQDIEALERSHEFNGLYHVLGGLLSPLDGVTANDLRINNLENRLKQKKSTTQEVVLAFDNNVEGESTAIYLAKLLKPLQVKVTRLARGLPVGSDLEYADEVTLKDAIKHRWEI